MEREGHLLAECGDGNRVWLLRKDDVSGKGQSLGVTTSSQTLLTSTLRNRRSGVTLLRRDEQCRKKLRPAAPERRCT